MSDVSSFFKKKKEKKKFGSKDPSKKKQGLSLSEIVGESDAGWIDSVEPVKRSTVARSNKLTLQEYAPEETFSEEEPDSDQEETKQQFHEAIAKAKKEPVEEEAAPVEAPKPMTWRERAKLREQTELAVDNEMQFPSLSEAMGAGSNKPEKTKQEKSGDAGGEKAPKSDANRTRASSSQESKVESSLADSVQSKLNVSESEGPSAVEERSVEEEKPKEEKEAVQEEDNKKQEAGSAAPPAIEASVTEDDLARFKGLKKKKKKKKKEEEGAE